MPSPHGDLTTLTPDQLADLCWRLINEGVQTGRITVPGGEIKVVSDDRYILMLQWAATLRLKKPKAVQKPEDFAPRVTRHRKEGP